MNIPTVIDAQQVIQQVGEQAVQHASQPAFVEGSLTMAIVTAVVYTLKIVYEWMKKEKKQ